MKLIHCADLHLASKLDSHFSYDKSRKRRKELYDSFSAIADYAVEQQVTAILICGDIFDESKPKISEIRQFIDIVQNHPQVDFLCLAGNHDENLCGIEGLPHNLLTFGEDLQKYNYGPLDIYGIEPAEQNSGSYYEKLQFDREQINILMLHGQIVNTNTKGNGDTVVLPRLRDLGIDYLALGHIHSYSSGRLDNRGIYCYSGCPEGRGYDECGQRGFVLLDVDCQSGKIEHSFLPFANRTIYEISVNVEGLENTAQIFNRIIRDTAHIESKNMLRVHLLGKIPPKTRIYPKTLEEELKNRFFHASVKDDTGLYIDPEEFKDELSLKGEFYRTVMESEEISPKEKEQVLRAGLLALAGEEAE